MFKKKETGFTLFEVLAVVAIIGILASFIVPKVAENVAEARDNACLANIKYLEGVIERYRLAKGTLPQTLTELNGWYQGEYPVCPKPAAPLVGKKTGYFFNKVTGKVTTSGGSLIEIENP
ncbi:MAG: prepilin-type N-terminal cleavage/methylation domain-containing protein [Clostridia bacterium]|jgi:prepilin-type N-terminal cleavage/methylation domain-containing protein|nr:prepilin-type N-terminal cleavage/methylation domain-containing protein [Clostridia bacterium]